MARLGRAAGGSEVGEGAVHADAVDDVLRRRADARFLAGGPIEVGDDRHAEGAGRRHERPLGGGEIAVAGPEDADRTICSCQRAAEGIGFRPLEVGQQLSEAPARVAQRRPLVVVGGGAAQPDAAVDRGGAADNPRARQREWRRRVAAGEGVAPIV